MSVRNCRRLLHLRLLCTPFTRSLATTASTPSQTPQLSSSSSSFTVNFLTTACGLTPAQALSAARTIHIDEIARGKPESILTLLRSHGFSDAQIAEIVARLPRVLIRAQEKLGPKLQFLTRSGFPLEYIVREPSVLLRSLDRHIRPRVEFLRRFLVTADEIRTMCRRSSWCLTYDLKNTMIPNVGLLLDLGVAAPAVGRLLVSHTRSLMMIHERFVEIVQIVQDWGVKPHSKMFPHAVRALCALGECSLAARLQLFKQLGWSEEEVRSAFRRSPLYIAVSEHKILRISSFAGKLGLGPSDLSRKPVLLMLAFEKRILPRYAVWQVLTARGLIEQRTSKLISMFVKSEKLFADGFVRRYVDKVPELMDVYLGKIKVEGLEIGGDEIRSKSYRESAANDQCEPGTSL